MVAGRDSPWLQLGAACLQSKWELSADTQPVPHAGRITRNFCVWRIPLHIIIPLIMLKEQSPCTWIVALLGITNLNRERSLWEQLVQRRASLTNSFFFSYYFNLYIFQPNCAAVRTKQIIPGTAFIIVSKVEVLCSVCFRPRQLPKDCTSKIFPRLSSQHHHLGFLATVSCNSGPASPYNSPHSLGSPNISDLSHVQVSCSRKWSV